MGEFIILSKVPHDFLCNSPTLTNIEYIPSLRRLGQLAYHKNAAFDIVKNRGKPSDAHRAKEWRYIQRSIG